MGGGTSRICSVHHYGRKAGLQSNQGHTSRFILVIAILELCHRQDKINFRE